MAGSTLGRAESRKSDIVHTTSYTSLPQGSILVDALFEQCMIPNTQRHNMNRLPDGGLGCA